MRIRTEGESEYRTDLYERTADTLGENTKSAGIDAACVHANQDVRAKAEAMEFLRVHLSAEQLETVAELLSTDPVPVSADVKTQVGQD
jgi:hypothetical protein